MNTGLYLRIALSGMRRNRRLYAPYGMTCMLMVCI